MPAQNMPQWRAEFDAHVVFSNGGDLRTEGFRLDIPGRGIDDAALGELFVRHLGLLMVDRVIISRKALIQEQHKGSRGVQAGPAVRHVVDLGGPAARAETNGVTSLAGLVDLPGVVVRPGGSAATTVGRTALAPFEVAGHAVLLHSGGHAVLAREAAEWLAAQQAALVATDAPTAGPAAAVLRAAGIPALTGLGGLDLLPPRGFRLHAVPFSSGGPSGGSTRPPVPAGTPEPVRAYAIIDGNNDRKEQ